MLGKVLLIGGLALSIVGGVIWLAVYTGTSMAQSSYAPSVQAYAEQNASVGDPLAYGVMGLGLALALAGLVITFARRVSH